MTPRLLTYQQAAAVLNVSPKTIARRVKAGALAVVVDGGLRRIPEQALTEYVQQRTVAPRGLRETSRRPLRSAKNGRADVAVEELRKGQVRRLWEDAQVTAVGELPRVDGPTRA